MWFFLTVSWVSLQHVIVVFPDHTHLLFVIQQHQNQGRFCTSKMHLSSSVALTAVRTKAMALLLLLFRC